jgi:hypothetical protein
VGVGRPSATGEASEGAGGTSSGVPGHFGAARGAPADGGKTGSAGGRNATASTPIPELPQQYYRYSFGSTYFVQVDQYVIQGINIPGTELCVAGDQLRSNGPMTITQIKTDHSKCRIKTFGDEEKEICPPAAKTEVVVFSGYLSTPVAYSINVCREYDKSHCRVLRRGTEWEREQCKVNFTYEGVWSADTIFEYRCVNSQTEIYRHPLQYNIRYMVESPRNDDDRMVKKEVYRITQSIPPCE